MPPLTSNFRLAGAALGAVVAVTPLCSGACGSTACFVYSQAQYDANSGCPSQSSAIKNFTSPSCPGAVTEVDSAGSFDGAYCCYSVTQQQSQGDVSCGQGGFVGVGGTGGFAGSGAFAGAGGTGGGCALDGDPCDPAGSFPCCSGLACDTSNQCVFPGSGGAGVGGFGAGGSGGAGCVSCSEEINALGSTASQLCGDAAPLWDALTTCSCDNGVCSATCSLTFCAGVSPDSGCVACLDDATNGCGQAFGACDAN